MPKMKTNSGSKKRFTLTGTGKIKRKHAFHLSAAILSMEYSPSFL